MPEGFWWDVCVKYRWKPKENMERCQREIWWNVRGEEGEMFGGCSKGHKKVNLGFVAVQQFFFVQVGHFLLLSVGR